MSYAPPRSPAEKILAYSIPEPNSGCWLWLSTATYSSPSKIPQARVRVGYKMYLAHRVSYEAYVGPVPDDILVCHRCDNPMCVNPAHLFLGTHKDNTQDMIAKGRDRFFFCERTKCQ